MLQIIRLDFYDQRNGRLCLEFVNTSYISSLDQVPKFSIKILYSIMYTAYDFYSTYVPICTISRPTLYDIIVYTDT